MVLAGGPWKTGQFSGISRSAADARYGARLDLLQYRKPTIAALGDSITSNGFTNGGAGPRNWLLHACLASGGELFWVDNVGGGGYKTEQIRTELLPIVLTLEPAPGYVAVLAGTNDSGVTAFASWTTSYSTMLDAIAAAGIIAVVCAIPPSDTASKHGDNAKMNLWLAHEARARGLPWVNWLPDLMDPATGGGWLAGLETDGTHPEEAGAQAMGAAFWREFGPYLAGQPSWTPYLATSNTDPINLMTNGLFLTDSDSDGRADNIALFSSGGANASALPYGTPSLVAASDGTTVGNWQRLTRTASSPAGFVDIRTNTTISADPGDVLDIAFRFQCALTGTTSGEAMGQVGVYQYNSTTQPAGNVDGAAGTRARFWGNGHANLTAGPVTVYQQVTVRSAATGGVRFVANLGDPPDGDWLQVAQLTIVNLTDLGIA